MPVHFWFAKADETTIPLAEIYRCAKAFSRERHHLPSLEESEEQEGDWAVCEILDYIAIGNGGRTVEDVIARYADMELVEPLLRRLQKELQLAKVFSGRFG